MSWASRRQFKYFSILMVIVALIIFAIIYPMIFKKPTCSDGKQNGTEGGVDCGGVCNRMCKSEIAEPAVLWSRAFPVTGNSYNLVAYVENRNKDSGVFNAPYEFRIYDTNNKLIGRRVGNTFIPPNQQFAVFESRFDSGQAKIKSVSFEFTPSLVWIKKDPSLQTLPIYITKILLDNNASTPSLSAVVNNDSIQDLPAFDVIAILYDINHNAINASKTHKDKLQNSSTLPIVFTWPEALTGAPVTEDILISINPFTVSF